MHRIIDDHNDSIMKVVVYIILRIRIIVISMLQGMIWWFFLYINIFSKYNIQVQIVLLYHTTTNDNKK